ncbi:hypothetical protein [Bacteroides caecigallinarum]|nr:hypothetical protein [Bacteroides caecigallinarum]
MCQELTLKRSLHMADAKEDVKRNCLKELYRQSTNIATYSKTVGCKCSNWNLLIANLHR